MNMTQSTPLHSNNAVPDVPPQKVADSSGTLHPLLANRWSPRGFDHTHMVDQATLTNLLEAARWAPSANNSQPWLFLPAHRGDAMFRRLSELLAPGNAVWAPTASVLMLVAYRSSTEAGQDLPWAAYDTGQAMAMLSLQALSHGLFVHQMAGFDQEAARDRLALDPAVHPMVMAAIGKFDPASDLPEPFAGREQEPRTRKPLDTLLLPTVE